MVRSLMVFPRALIPTADSTKLRFNPVPELTLKAGTRTRLRTAAVICSVWRFRSKLRFGSFTVGNGRSDKLDRPVASVY